MLPSSEKTSTDPCTSHSHPNVVLFTLSPFELGASQTATSALELRAGDFVLGVFKKSISVSPSPLSLSNAIPAGFQSQILWGVSFYHIFFELKSQVWGLDPQSQGGPLPL